MIQIATLSSLCDWLWAMDHGVLWVLCETDQSQFIFDNVACRIGSVLVLLRFIIEINCSWFGKRKFRITRGLIFWRLSKTPPKILIVQVLASKNKVKSMDHDLKAILEEILEDHLDVKHESLTLNWSQLLEITIIESESCLNMTDWL